MTGAHHGRRNRDRASGRGSSGHDHIEDVEPAVYSAFRRLELLEPLRTSNVVNALSAWVEELQEWARGRGYLVGHIKVLLESGEQYARLSGTGRGVQLSASPEWERTETGSLELSLAAVLIGPTDRELEPLATGALERALDGMGSHGTTPGD